MRIYEQGRSVPEDALKPFSNGRFSGTDINPMWRIKKLTELFGPAGFGWFTEITRQDTIEADEGNVMVFVDLNLYVKDGDTWSKPIFGTGGNTLKAKGRADDDGFKKAYTDALSIACKALGIGADVWYQNDTTSKYADKYVNQEPPPQEPAREPVQAARAAAGQIQFITAHATQNELETLRKQYGPNLERMPFERASKAVMHYQNQINGGNG